MAFEFAQISIDDLEPKPETKKEQYERLFKKMEHLQIIAVSQKVISNRDWFIRGGIPAEFYDSLIKCHLIAEIPGKNVFFNRSQNLKYPACTWDNFLEGITD